MKKFILLDTFLIDGFYVTQNYFANKTYYSQFNLLGHEGIDLGHTNKKIMVRSSLSGICFASYDKNYGNFVVVEDHKQQCAVYACHMINVMVISGQEIKVGDELGEMDDEGNSNGEHVHFNFLILENGSNKYHKKEFNWGYLDPQYPRDTGNQVKFPGVEDYQIEWKKEIQGEPMQNDLQNVLTYYKVKTSDELIKMIDEQLKFLAEERKKTNNLEKELYLTKGDKEKLMTDLATVNYDFNEYKNTSEARANIQAEKYEQLLTSKTELEQDAKDLVSQLESMGFVISRDEQNTIKAHKINYTVSDLVTVILGLLKKG